VLPYPHARRGLVQLTAVVAVLGSTSVAAAAVQARLAARVDEQQIVLDAHAASLARLPPPLAGAELAALRGQRERISGQLEVFDRLERRRHGVVPALDAVIRGHMAPPQRFDDHGLWVTAYREAGGNLSVEGAAIDNADISEFMRDLQKDDRFSDVQLCFTKCNDDIDWDVPWYSFRLGMKVDYAK
jgi:type IV pilus assembly protein PilN